MRSPSPCPGLRLPEEPFIVHHWDADGIASAALVARHKGASGTAVPEIGVYSGDAIPHPLQKAAMLVLDYGIPGPEYARLAARLEAPLTVVDHHKVEPPPSMPGLQYCNPVAEGRGGEEKYPAASLLVYRLLGTPRRPGDMLLAALGVVGDLAPFIDAGRSHPGLMLAAGLAEKAGMGLVELRRLAARIDSCYRLLDTSCIKHAVEQAARDPYALLADRRLAEAEQRASRLLEEALQKLKPLREERNLRVYYLEMDAYVTSALGRRLAADNPSGVAVLVHHIPQRRGGYIYARSISRQLGGVIPELRSLGVKAGGKSHVVVIEYRGGPWRVLETLLGLLKRQR